MALPQLALCASSGRAWRLWPARHSQEEADLQGAQPLPRVLERTASRVAHFPAFDHSGLSRAEMETKMAKCIDEWESAKWWDDTLPSWLKEKKEENPTIKPVLPGSRAAAGR